MKGGGEWTTTRLEIFTTVNLAVMQFDVTRARVEAEYGAGMIFQQRLNYRQRQ